MAKKKTKTIKKVERIGSGIPGLDSLIEGGIIKGTTTLVSGGAGTGKTIFCIQFIVEGLKKGEKCMFITLEERPEDIKADVIGFGWDLKKYIDNGQLILEYHDPFKVTDITTPLVDRIKKHNISRVAVDSTSVLGLYFKNSFEVRRQLFKLLMALKDSNVTTLVTAETPEEGKTLSRFGVEEFITDAVIILVFVGIGGQELCNLQIRKMRRTAHATSWYPFDITNKGVRIGKERKRILMK